ncbi:hypothetical protein [Nocardiopsis alba]|uniref:hypothetical protein n=1 Tax=Nocardiopsis alba TaxID=53437 RepID=UPI00366CD0B1
MIDHYDRERRAAARTQREATQALAAVRSRITLLEIAVLAERARADRAEAALKRAT